MSDPHEHDNAPLKTPDQFEEDHPDKKAQILALYESGMHSVEELALITATRASYIASVLRESELEPSYFDLYTSTKHSMNVYSKFFAGKLAFKNVEAARESVAHIDHVYRQFATGRDRAGQHHAMMMALTMANRAQWTGKRDEAHVYREWLIGLLESFEPGEEG